MTIQKPKKEDISRINEILLQWTSEEEATKYCERIQNEINGVIEYNTKFWEILENDLVIGIGGISEILPKIREYAQTEYPLEIKILYLDKNFRGKGYGKSLLKFLEDICVTENSNEILIRSAQQYKTTAYDFYLSQGYKLVGMIDVDMAVFRKVI